MRRTARRRRKGFEWRSTKKNGLEDPPMQLQRKADYSQRQAPGQRMRQAQWLKVHRASPTAATRTVPESAPIASTDWTSMGFLAGKRLLITGVLSNRSIAYGIARACHREGAELAFSYVGERFKDRITEFAAEFGSTLVFDCDVGDDAQIERLFAAARPEHWPSSTASCTHRFAPREAIAGDFLDGLSREASASPTTSRPTASRPWPRPPAAAAPGAARC
jgi:hypothetical protein